MTTWIRTRLGATCEIAAWTASPSWAGAEMASIAARIAISFTFGSLVSAFLRPRRPQLDPARQAPRIVREQIEDDLRNVLGGQLPVSLAAAPAVAEPGRHRSRHHVADADVVVANFLHQRFAERVQARLGRAVRRAAGERVLAGQAADVDDPAAAAAAHLGNRGARAVEDAAQVRVDHLAPVLDAHVAGVGEAADAGVVDQDVDRAEALDRGAHEPLGLARHAHVATHRVHARAAAELLLRSRQIVLFTRADDDLHAAIEERARDCKSDPFGSPGDDGDAWRAAGTARARSCRTRRNRRSHDGL